MSLKVYIICPVRAATPEQKKEIMGYVAHLMDNQGCRVHNPLTDVDQSDPLGMNICNAHKAFMETCDEVHVFFDTGSTGCHFDLGMAFALGKPVKLVKAFQEDHENKSYLKVLSFLHREWAIDQRMKDWLKPVRRG